MLYDPLSLDNPIGEGEGPPPRDIIEDKAEAPSDAPRETYIRSRIDAVLDTLEEREKDSASCDMACSTAHRTRGRGRGPLQCDARADRQIEQSGLRSSRPVPSQELKEAYFEER